MQKEDLRNGLLTASRQTINISFYIGGAGNQPVKKLGLWMGTKLGRSERSSINFCCGKSAGHVISNAKRTQNRGRNPKQEERTSEENQNVEKPFQRLVGERASQNRAFCH